MNSPLGKVRDLLWTVSAAAAAAAASTAAASTAAAAAAAAAGERFACMEDYSTIVAVEWSE